MAVVDDWQVIGSIPAVHYSEENNRNNKPERRIKPPLVPGLKNPSVQARSLSA